MNGVARADAIHLEGALEAFVDKLCPHFPLGVNVVDSEPSDPCGEALVQPELIPPVHGDEVSEPLVSKLVGNNVGNIVLKASRGSLLVKEHAGRAVGDQTPVLHGAVGELVDSQKIRLGERVVNIEDFGKVVNGLGGVLESVAALLLEAAGSVHADGELLAVVAALGESLDVLEVTDGPGQEVAAHDGSSLKRDELPALLGRLGLLDRHVAKSNLVVGDLNLEIVCGLQIGLVKAGESSAGVAGLELGAEHVVPLIVAGDRVGRSDDGLVLASVEASHVVVDDTLERNDDGSLLGDGDILVKGNGGALSGLIVGDVGGLPALSGLGVIDRDLGLGNLELDRVENDLLRGLDNFRFDAAARLTVSEWGAFRVGVRTTYVSEPW